MMRVLLSTCLALALLLSPDLVLAGGRSSGEVPVKCPKCKESFSIEDFGLVDCPGCSAELLVWFDAATRKKVIRPANEAAIVPSKQKRTATTTEPQQESVAVDPVAGRFGKIE